MGTVTLRLVSVAVLPVHAAAVTQSPLAEQPTASQKYVECRQSSIAPSTETRPVPQVLRAVREELKAGADFLKVMAGGGVASETDAIESVQFLAEEIQAITRTVKQMSGGKKMVTAHAYTVEGIRHAIDNGVTGIEHGNLLDEPTARLMADKGAFLTPTLSCYGIMTRAPFENFLSDDGKVKNAQVMRKGLEALVLAEKCGVTVCYGTDLLSSMSALQTEEFYVRSTVLPAQTILRQATVNPARMLRMEGKLGVIAPGAFADMIVLAKNPLVRPTSPAKPRSPVADLLARFGRTTSACSTGPRTTCSPS